MDSYIKKGMNIVVYLIQVYIFSFIAVAAFLGTVAILGVVGVLSQTLSSIMSIMWLAALCAAILTLFASFLFAGFLVFALSDSKEMIPVWRGERSFFSELVGLAKFCQAVVQAVVKLLHNEKGGEKKTREQNSHNSCLVLLVLASTTFLTPIIFIVIMHSQVQ